MSGLREYQRDVGPLTACGDERLAPPSPQDLLGLVARQLARPGAPLPVQARWSYARWKPRTSLTAGFELDYADGQRRWVSWKRYADGKADELAQRRERDVSGDVADPLLAEHVLLRESGAHLWAPPYDRELPGLERALDLRRSKRWFLEQGLFAGRRVRSGSSRATILRYKPERRAVLRLDLKLRPIEGGPKTSETLAARALPLPEAERVARARSAWQASAAGALAPPLIAHEAAAGVLYEAWIDVEACAHDDFDLAHAAGGLLARLHADGAPDALLVPAHGIAGAVELLATQPELAPHLRGLTLEPAAGSGPLVWTHGDFHPDQLARARADGALRLLDLDRLGGGPALADLVSWVADHLVEREGADLGQASAELLAGYAQGGARPPREAELASAVAAELVRRAAGALRRLERDAARKAGRLLELARELAPVGVLFT